MMANMHLVMTPARPPTHADSARAAEIVATLERTIGRYRDPAEAEQDGFKRFLPNVKRQRTFHYTKTSNALGAAFRFDPAAPTSLLYRPDAQGKLELVGAMYTAPARASEEELDRRFPLSVAHWHRHVNLCLPKRGEEPRWLEKRDGHMLFGPEGSIATEADCSEANGRFVPALFGWMVHVGVFGEN